MDGRGYGLIRILLWKFKGNGRNMLYPNTGIVVEFKRKWMEDDIA